MPLFFFTTVRSILHAQFGMFLGAFYYKIVKLVSQFYYLLFVLERKAFDFDVSSIIIIHVLGTERSFKH